ncbi:MAG: CopD family protein [Pseudomonadota bacterium]
MYEVLKIVHLTAMVVWMAGMLLAPILIIEVSKLQERPAAAAALRRWYLRVFSLAMILLWIAGIAIMTLGGWFQAPWMIAKLVLVLVLSGLHGALSGQMRRMASEDHFQPWSALRPIWIGTILVLAIIITLAVYRF